MSKIVLRTAYCVLRKIIIPLIILAVFFLMPLANAEESDKNSDLPAYGDFFVVSSIGDAHTLVLIHQENITDA